MLRRAGLWIVLTLSLLLTIYGFYERKLFAQEIWNRAGLERFLLLAAAYALCFVVVSLWRPGFFLPAVYSVVIVYTIASVGFLASLSVCLFLLSSLVLGEMLLGADSDAVLAMLLGMSIYMFAVSIAVLVPVNYPAVYLLALIAPLLWNYRITAARLQRIESLFQPFKPASRTEYLALGALTFVMLLHWLVALGPEVGSDALAMHLVVPTSVANVHKWAFLFKNHAWALMPMGGDWTYTVVYLLGGEAAARLLNFAFLLSIVLLLVSRGSFLIAALFAATPLVQLVTGSLFVENLWTLLLLGSLVSLSVYRDTRRARYLYLTFLLAGAAAATKFGALSFLAPLAVLVFATARPSARRACAAFACFLIFAAPPYLTAYAKTGNPVYPFLSSTGLGSDARFKSPLAFHTPYDLTFHSSQFFEGQDGAAGFQYLLLLPAAVLLVGRRWPYVGLASAVTFALFAILTFEVSSNLRYLYAAMPFAMLVIGSELVAIKAVDERLYRAAVALLAAVFCLDVYFLPSSGWYHKDFILNVASSRARASHVTALAPVRDLVAYLNRAHRGAPVAFFETNAIAGLEGPAFTSTWHTPEFSRRVSEADSPQACVRLMREYGTSFVVAPGPGSDVGVASFPVEAFLRNCVEQEYRAGTFYVARVHDDNTCREDQPGPPAPSGKYDDVDLSIVYSGAWTRGRFPQAAHGTVTYSNAPNASFRFQFTGSEVTYIYSRAFNRGAVEVLIDGVSQGKLNLYSKPILWQSATRFRCAGPGPHILEVRNTGRAFIDVDAIEVR